MAVSEIIPTEEGRGLYRALAFRRILVICGLIVALAFSFSLDLALGPARYPLSEVLSGLESYIPGSPGATGISWIPQRSAETSTCQSG